MVIQWAAQDYYSLNCFIDRTRFVWVYRIRQGFTTELILTRFGLFNTHWTWSARWSNAKISERRLPRKLKDYVSEKVNYFFGGGSSFIDVYRSSFVVFFSFVVFVSLFFLSWNSHPFPFPLSGAVFSCQFLSLICIFTKQTELNRLCLLGYVWANLHSDSSTFDLGPIKRNWWILDMCSNTCLWLAHRLFRFIVYIFTLESIMSFPAQSNSHHLIVFKKFDFFFQNRWNRFF